jgi:hypothetical protein
MVKKMDMERFILKQEGTERAVSGYNKNKFAALESLDDDGDINKTWNEKI